MTRLVLLCLLTATTSAGDGPLLALPEAERAAAVRALLAPGRSALPSGKISLANATEILAASGNRIILADNVDDRREAVLPPVDGPWWEGVRAVCTAFSLRFDEGIVSGDRLEGDGSPIPVGHGVLVLSPDPSGPPAFAVAGAIAVIAEAEPQLTATGRTLNIRTWARAEPRIPRGRLAWGRVMDAQLTVVGSANLGLRPTGIDNGETRPPSMLWQADIGQIEPATLSTSLTLRISPLERWTAHGELKPGGQAQLQVASQVIDIALHAEGSPATWQTLTLPERRPLVSILGPDSLMNGCIVKLRSGGQELSSGGGGGGGASVGDGRSSIFRFPRNLAGDPLDVVLEGSLAISPTDFPVTIAAGTRRLVTLTDPDTPTRLNWPAGSQPLSRWIALISAGGNTILPEVGIDTNVVIALPAVTSCFWDGVLALCAAADLVPAPTAGNEVASGPLRLIRRHGKPLIAAACGPLLLVAEPPTVVQDGAEREAQVRLTMIAEPRLPADRFLTPAIAWATFADDQDGAPAQVLTPLADREAGSEPQPPARQRLVRRGSAPETTENLTTLVAAVRIPRQQARSLTLTGLLMLQRSRSLRTSAEVAVGGTVEVVFGTRPVEISTTGLPELRNGSGLILRGVSGFENLSLSITNEDGSPMETSGMSPAGREPGLRLARCKLPPAGNLTVELTAREQRPPLALPVRLVVPLP